MWKVSYVDKYVTDEFYFYRSSAREALWTVFTHDSHTKEEIDNARTTLDNQYFIAGIGSYEEICVKDISKATHEFEVRLSTQVSALNEDEAENLVLENLNTIMWDTIEVEAM